MQSRVTAIAFAVALVMTFWSVPLAGREVAAAGCTSAGTPTSTVYLPNITKTLGGPTGWVTPFIVQNVGAATTTLEISFYRFSDGGLVTCRTVAGLLPGTSFADVPNNDADLPDDSQFSVVVRSFGSEVVSVVNEQQGTASRAEGLSYVGLSEGSTTVALPYVAKSADGWTTTIVVQDLGVADAVVTAAFSSADGTATASLTRTIAAGSSRFIDPIFEASLAAGTEYSALLTSTQPIAAVVNAHNDAASVPAPRGFSYNGITVGSAGSAYLPYATRSGDGSATRVVVQNAGTKDATPMLTFRGASGQPTVVTGPAPVKPGRVWSFDARALAPGDYGLVVSGGTFAAVGVTLSASTAVGMASTRPATQRLYLPNITRTLGGPSGWTTPIVLQSAGATSAVLRWYRFADGTLAVTQYVPGLVTGGTVRIDPRVVTGLVDGTQYAVVVDAVGGAAAAVLELNELGGDGAMAYEGFAATGTLTAAPSPATVVVSPAAAVVGPGSTQQLTATVMDGSGNAMIEVPLTWSVSPSTLGTIDANGLFTAGSSEGTGSVTARFGTLTGTATVSVALQTVTTGGFTFVWRSTASADVYTEQSITSADATTIATTVSADVASVESTYERPYDARPQVYVFATTASYTTGLQTVFALPPVDATVTGAQTCGVFQSSQWIRAVGLNWGQIELSLPYTCARHELTHAMIDQIARPVADGDLPAWINEGSARQQQFTVAGSDWWAMLNRVGAASARAAGMYFDLDDLVSQDAWNARTGDDQDLEYFEASQVVDMLRSDIGTSGVTRILELVGEGVSFTEAFLATTGEDLAAFSAAVPSRLLAISASYPAIATAPDTYYGAGLTFTFYGFRPGSSVTFAIKGSGGSSRVTTRATDAFGAYTSFLGSEWPKGTYTFTVTGVTSSNVTTTVTTTAAKISSLAGAQSFDAPFFRDGVADGVGGLLAIEP